MAPTRKDAAELYRGLVRTAVARGEGDLEKGIRAMQTSFDMPEFYANGIRARHRAEGVVPNEHQR